MSVLVETASGEKRGRIDLAEDEIGTARRLAAAVGAESDAGDAPDREITVGIDDIELKPSI